LNDSRLLSVAFKSSLRQSSAFASKRK
jgi:hypothetical protein